MTARRRSLEDQRLTTCPGCGGAWFREAVFYRFYREELYTFGDTWPDLVGQCSLMPMGVAVCLCGLPQRPNVGGLRGGRTANLELLYLVESLQSAQGLLDGRALRRAAEQDLVKPEDLDVLERRLKSLEKLVGRQLARRDPDRGSPRGRRWAPPQRKPLSGKDGTLTRDKLVLELQGRGLSFRKARQVLGAMLAAMAEELDVGGRVETPLGRLYVARRKAAKQFVRFGRQIIVNQNPKRVAFKLDPAMRAALRSQPEAEEIPLPRMEDPTQLRCEKCGSIEFVEAWFKQYLADFASASPGGGLISVTENAMPTLVCLCGHPVMPGLLRTQAAFPRRANIDTTLRRTWDSFKESLDAAVRYRETLFQQQLLDTFEERFASRQRHDSLAERVANLERILQDLPRAPER